MKKLPVSCCLHSIISHPLCVVLWVASAECVELDVAAQVEVLGKRLEVFSWNASVVKDDY